MINGGNITHAKGMAVLIVNKLDFRTKKKLADAEKNIDSIKYVTPLGSQSNPKCVFPNRDAKYLKWKLTTEKRNRQI